MNAKGRWLVSTLFWGPLMGWVLWPLFDARLSWSPWVGGLHLAALAAGWDCTGRLGLTHRRWPMAVAIVTAFDVAFAVAARSTDIATFFAGSLAGGGVASGLISVLIVIASVQVARVRNYGALEDWLLLVVPGIEAAMAVGMTTGAIARSWSSVLVGLAAGLGAGALVAMFVLGWVYGLVGLTAFFLDRSDRQTEDRQARVWLWKGQEE